MDELKPEVKGGIRVMSKEEIIEWIESMIGKRVICDFRNNPHVEEEEEVKNEIIDKGD